MDEEKLVASREEVCKAITELLETYESLPTGAMLQPVTHYDLQSVLLLLLASLRVD